MQFRWTHREGDHCVNISQTWRRKQGRSYGGGTCPALNLSETRNSETLWSPGQWTWISSGSRLLLAEFYVGILSQPHGSRAEWPSKSTTGTGICNENSCLTPNFGPVPWLSVSKERGISKYITSLGCFWYIQDRPVLGHALQTDLLLFIF